MYFLSLSLCNISILVPAEIPINFVTWCAHLRQPIACLDGRSLAQLQTKYLRSSSDSSVGLFPSNYLSSSISSTFQLDGPISEA